MNKYDIAMIKTAYIWADLSYCKRLKVGCVIAKDNRIISCGYNGTISKSDNNCEDENNKTKGSVIHSEMNALLFALKNGLSVNNAIMYITHSPCINCAKHIVQAGIKKVVYNKDYRDNEGIEFLKQYIEVIKIDI